MPLFPSSAQQSRNTTARFGRRGRRTTPESVFGRSVARLEVMRIQCVVGTVIVAALTACATWRWSGSPPNAKHPLPPAEEAAIAGVPLVVSTSPRVDAPPVTPPTPDDRFKTAQFYSDLGPDTVDVSAYPTQQRLNYAIYARDCSRCHTLARSNNAPFVARGWWEFYMLGMRIRSNSDGRPLPKDEVKAILDFLDYDSRLRKVERARDFERLTEDLKVRFDESVAERLGGMQRKKQPRLLP